MDTTRAITFRFPKAMTLKAITAVRITPRLGFPFGPDPSEKGRRKGNIRSPARD